MEFKDVKEKTLYISEEIKKNQESISNIKTRLDSINLGSNNNNSSEKKECCEPECCDDKKCGDEEECCEPECCEEEDCCDKNLECCEQKQCCDDKEQPLDDTKEQPVVHVKEELLDDDVKEELLDNDVKEQPLDDVKEELLADDLKEELLDNDVKEESLTVLKNTELSSIMLPNSIEYIGKQAFEGCELLDDSKVNEIMDLNNNIVEVDLEEQSIASSKMSDTNDNVDLIEESVVNTEPDNESEYIGQSCDINTNSKPFIQCENLSNLPSELTEFFKEDKKYIIPKLDISSCILDESTNKGYDVIVNAPRNIEQSKKKSITNSENIKPKKSWWRFW